MRREPRGRGEACAQAGCTPPKPGAAAGEESVSCSPPRSPPLAFPPLILFAIECWEQRPGEPPATALPPAHPSQNGSAPLSRRHCCPGELISTGVSRRAEQGPACSSLDTKAGHGRASSAGMRGGVRGCIPAQRGAPCSLHQLYPKPCVTLSLEESLNHLGPLPGSSQLGSSLSVPDHRVRPRKLPGQEDGVHFSLSKHYGVWLRQHPLPEGGVWRVSTRVGMISQGGWWGEECLSMEWDWLSLLCSAGGRQAWGIPPCQGSAVSPGQHGDRGRGWWQHLWHHPKLPLVVWEFGARQCSTGMLPKDAAKIRVALEPSLVPILPV